MGKKARARKAVRETRKRIQKLTDKWLTPLGLGWWERLTFLYSTDRDAFEREEGETVMIVNPSWEYKTARITVNCFLCAQMPQGHLEGIFLHELAHIILDELDAKNDHEERVCTNLSQIFRWVWLAGAGKLDC